MLESEGIQFVDLNVSSDERLALKEMTGQVTVCWSKLKTTTGCEEKMQDEMTKKTTFSE